MNNGRNRRTFMLASILCCLSVSSSHAITAGNGPSWETEAVTVTGASLSELDGERINTFGLFRWEPVQGIFQITPFQIDERVDRVFNAGSEFEFTQNMYDVSGLEDGRLDGDDELVFLFQDAGVEAPANAPWPEGSSSPRYTIAVTNPDDPADIRYVYLFRLDVAPTPTSYVTWDLSQYSSIATSVYTLDYIDKWLLTGYRVQAPCGSGADLIDRLKARAGVTPEKGETEELWNVTAVYLGGLIGPVRAIRYVRGAASGFNTIHSDVVYRNYWDRSMTFRVHPLDNAWMYFDWLPQAGLTYFSSSETDGVSMDGQPDSVPVNTVPAWELVRSPGGGMTWLTDFPPSPYVIDRKGYYRDDAAYDDAPLNPPGYSDDDDSAIGNHGIHADGLIGDELSPIYIRARIHPLCGDVGDAAMGAEYRRMWETGFTFQTTPEWRVLGAIRDLTVQRDLLNIVLSWQAVSGAETYRVYASVTPDLPRASWTLLGETAGLTWQDPVDPVTRHYSVVPVANGAEGDW